MDMTIPDRVDLDQFQHLTLAKPSQIKRWLAEGLLKPETHASDTPSSPDHDASQFNQFEIMLGALLAELERVRLNMEELRSITNLLHEGAGYCNSSDIPVPTMARALQIRMVELAEEDGHFDELASAAPDDPFLGAASNAAAYETASRYSQYAPTNAAMAIVRSFHPFSIDPAILYVQLMLDDGEDDATVSPFWDVVCEFDNARILPRDDLSLPWSIEDGSDVATFVTISLPALKRMIAGRARSLKAA